MCDLVARHRPVAVYVAGSLARGEFVAGLSDVDVLVVTERPPAKHERFQLAAVGDTDVEITLVSLEEAVRALGEGAGFTAQAIREGVLVYGEPVEGPAGGAERAPAGRRASSRRGPRPGGSALDGGSGEPRA